MSGWADGPGGGTLANALANAFAHATDADGAPPRTRLYIAGPMTGHPDFNYAAFYTAEQQLRAAGYDVLNPAHTENENTTRKPQEWGWYMRRAIALLMQADGVALLDGWTGSRGARLEEEIAGRLGMWRDGITQWLTPGYDPDRAGEILDPRHKPDHADTTDAGGYCNALVTDEDGYGDTCGYRTPAPAGTRR